MSGLAVRVSCLSAHLQGAPLPCQPLSHAARQGQPHVRKRTSQGKVLCFLRALRSRSPGRPLGSSSLLFWFWYLEFETHQSRCYLRWRQEMLMWFLQLQLAELLPRGPLLLAPSCQWIAGEHPRSQRRADSASPASSGRVLSVGPVTKRKLTAAPKDILKSSLFLAMVQGELNLGMIAGI